ncbi:MAG: ribose-phosphate diphosphokinase, partial [bacterium]|nr:ribose-phosphate diphosphokinase [bacterium]
MDMPLKLFCGRANVPLAEAIAHELSLLEGKEITCLCIVDPHNDGEAYAQYPDNIRGADIFLIQPTPQPADNWVELLVMLDAARRASAEELTAVMPYFGYARQDRKVKPRTPITAALASYLTYMAGAKRILTTDLHAGQIQGFTPFPAFPFDDLEAIPILLRKLRRDTGIDFKKAALVSPDATGVKRVDEVRKRIPGCERMTFILKLRPDRGVSRVHSVADPDEVKDCDVLMIDDMVDTAGTLAKAAEALRDIGVQRIFAACVHPVFSTDRKTSERGAARIAASPIEALYVTDTIPLGDRVKTGSESDKIRVVSVAPLFAEAIHAIHHRG